MIFFVWFSNSSIFYRELVWKVSVWCLGSFFSTVFSLFFFFFFSFWDCSQYPAEIWKGEAIYIQDAVLFLKFYQFYLNLYFNWFCSIVTVPLVSRREDGLRVYDKENKCFFCDVMDLKIARHLLTQHTDDRL